MKMWGLKIVKAFDSLRNIYLDLKYGALIELATTGVVPLLVNALKSSTAPKEGSI